MPHDSALPHTLPRDPDGMRRLVAMTSVPSGRVVETEPRLSPHALLMLVLTVAYLLLATAFTARLLDSIPARLDDAQLDGIAAWSAMLLGCGLALAVWGATVLPALARSALGWRARALILVVTGTLATLGGAWLDQISLAGLLEDPDGQSGRRATHLMVTALGAPDMGLPGLRPAGDTGLESTTGVAERAFLAAYMVMQSHQPDGAETAEAGAVAVLDALVARRIGTAAQVYDNVFVPSVRSLRDAFNNYVAAQMALAEDIRAIPEREAALLADTQANAVRNDAQETGGVLRGSTGPNPGASPVPSPAPNPAPNQATGPGVAPGAATGNAARLREIADALYEKRVTRLFGAVLPPGLEWEEFTAHPIVQARWRAALDVPEGVMLSTNMGFQSFQDSIYEPMRARAVAPKRDLLLSSPDAFAPGGPMHRDGQAALRWIAVPALALAVALAGILWHFSALAFQVGGVIAPRFRVRRVVVAAVLLAAAIGLLGSRAPVTRTAGFQRLEDFLHERAGPAWLVARGATAAADMVHAWGTPVRRLLLGGHEFGLAPFARKGGDAQAALERFTP